jgi:predicted XRE-type DNA-binding protein
VKGEELMRSKSSHTTQGNVFADLGFSSSESLALKFKAEILSALLDEISKRGYSQSELVTRLKEHQPQVSNLLRGKISIMSIEKLLTYADHLNVRFEVRRAVPSAKRRRVA